LFELHNGQSLELRNRYFTKSYINPTLWSLAIVDIDLKFLVLFPEKSVFYNFLDFGIGYPIKVPGF